MKTIVLTYLIVSLMAVLSVWADQTHPVPASNAEQLGTVHFPISCTAPARKRFNQGVAMLHSFWYEEAEKAFHQVARDDPDCAMAHWGIAMSLYRQLWATPPTAEELEQGWREVQTARSLSAGTDREDAYLAAVEALYRDPGSTDYGARKLAYTAAMKQVQNHYPDDRESAVFYALALISTASPRDKTYANQKKALALLGTVLEAEPNHPGVAHYIIHASDYPDLARLGLDAARGYAQIAPAAPHALHMPSHIFIRLGYWQDAVKSNLAAYQAAENHARENALTRTWDQQLHHMDYLIYAYLQSGQIGKARSILLEVKAITNVQPENTISAYALAAIRARFAVERKNWPEAARLEIVPADFPWHQFGWCEAITHFARGLGAAQIGAVDNARKSLNRLEALRDADKAADKHYSADQIEIQRLAVAAWIARAEGKAEEAERLMRAAAELEDSTEKDNVTPGPIVPARELLGELLLDLRQPASALKEFKASLAKAPNRRNGIDGTVRAEKLLMGSLDAGIRVR